MSEQKSNYMQQLDAWTQCTIIDPLHEAIVEGDGRKCDAVCEDVKKAIREKVLESYRNGLKAKARPARKEVRA
jgi:hypothetical protein